MRKHILFLLPIFSLLLSSCLNTYSLESISMDYNDMETNVLSAEAQEFEIGVTSTHSFNLHCDSSFVSFINNGVVTYNNSGVAVVRTTHKVYLEENKTPDERVFYIQATNKFNPERTAAIIFKQLSKEEDVEQDTTE